jgi:tetratricopeptide (TPR) repeat protein
MKPIIALLLTAALAPAAEDLQRLRDRQDAPALERTAAALHADAEKNPNDANRWYQSAIAYSYLAEVTYEKRDKSASERAAETGVKDADKAISLNPKAADYYRVLGTLCGQGVGFYYLPTNFGGGPDAAIKDYKKAIEIDPKNADAYLWLGVAYAKQHQNVLARDAFSKSLQYDPERQWTKEQLAKLPPQ